MALGLPGVAADAHRKDTWVGGEDGLSETWTASKPPEHVKEKAVSKLVASDAPAGPRETGSVQLAQELQHVTPIPLKIKPEKP